jgi:uncharacterized protein (TIGR03086 family)
MTANDIRELDSRAVRASVEVVSRATTDDLGRPTPCSDWTLGDLLAHMTVQHRGFAAASAGGGADPAVWEVRALGDDPISVYADATDHLLAAFAEDGVLEREFSLPEISTNHLFPATQAISFHFVDYVVHGWDVGRSLGVPFELDSELVEAALRIARTVPDGPRRLEPGAAFRPSLPAPDGAAPLDRIISALGRSPRWPD